MNSQIKSLGKQAGYTLIELSIAIAIISVLIMTALFGVQKILENNNVNATAQQVTLASSNINKYAVMLGDKAFAGLTTTTIPLGIWPDNLLVNTGTAAAPVYSKVSNPFGGEYINLNNAAGGYYVAITNVPISACLATVAAFGNTATAIETDETAISAATATATSKPTTPKAVKTFGALKIDQAAMVTACAPSAAGVTKKNVWVTYAL